MDTSDPTNAGVIDVAEFIDEQPVGRFQVQILLLCSFILFVDGFDTQAIGYVAPAIANEWKLGRGALGPVFSAGLFGLMIGALVLGPVADRVGRKNVLLLSTIAFGLGTLATVFVDGLTALIVLRFMTGLGLGGAMPNAVALTSEFSPRRRRATMVMAMFCGFSVGAALGGFIAAWLIPMLGWRSVFVVGGLAPLIYAPFLARSLPESIRFLTLTGRDDPRLRDILQRVAPMAAVAKNARFAANEMKLPGTPVAHLFKEGRTLTTLMFWIVFFTSLLDLYLLSNWLPTVLNDLGASISVAAIVGAMLQVGGLAGTFVLGTFVDRFSFRALTVVYLLGAIAVSAIGFSGHSIGLATLAIFCAGFCIVGGQIASNALAATYYPVAMRSTGVGWALGIGRAGSIIGPLVGGIMIAEHVSTQTLFVAAAVPSLIACAAAYVLNENSPAPDKARA